MILRIVLFAVLLFNGFSNSVQPLVTVPQTERLGFGPANLVSWSPDGAQIAVAGTLDLVIYTPELEVVTSSLLDAAANAVSWLPDGSLVLMTRANRDDTATTVYSAIVYVLSDSGQLTVRRTFESDTSVTITPILGSSSVGVLSSNGWTVYDSNFAERARFADVIAVEASPDGTRIALVTPPVIKVIDAGTLRVLDRFTGLRGELHAAAWSDDGVQLAGVEKTRVIVWDVATGKRRGVFARQTGNGWTEIDPYSLYIPVKMLDIEWIAEGMWAVLGAFPVSPSGTVYEWRLDGETNEHQVWMRDLSMYRLDRWLIVNGTGGYAQHQIVLDAARWQAIVSAPDRRTAFRIHSDAILSGPSSDNLLTLHRLADFSIIETIDSDAARVRDMQWSSDGGRFVTVHGDEVRVWDSVTRMPLAISLRHTSRIFPIEFAWSPDGKRLAVVSNDPVTRYARTLGTVRVWDVATQRPLARSPLHDAYVASFQWSGDGKQIASFGMPLCCDPYSVIWDSATGEVTDHLVSSPTARTDATLHPTLPLIAVPVRVPETPDESWPYRGAGLRVVNYETGEVVADFDIQVANANRFCPCAAEAPAWDPDGGSLAVRVSGSGDIYIVAVPDFS